tara:strand:+ start:401 stop:922 length:522 start_codon:yes stop_codon:yes gene_type:complete
MAGSLEFIKSATGSSVSSFSITDCFTDKYDVYKVVADDIVTSTETFVRLRFINSSGTVISTNDYDFADLFLKANTSFVERRYTNQDDIQDFNLSIGSVSGGAGNTIAYIFNPTNASSYTFLIWQASNVYDDSGTFGFGHKGIGVLTETSDITGLHFLTTTGTFTSTIKVYGVK